MFVLGLELDFEFYFLDFPQQKQVIGNPKIQIFSKLASVAFNHYLCVFSGYIYFSCPYSLISFIDYRFYGNPLATSRTLN